MDEIRDVTAYKNHVTYKNHFIFSVLKWRLDLLVKEIYLSGQIGSSNILNHLHSSGKIRLY